jgi:uncharacterized membrane protein
MEGQGAHEVDQGPDGGAALERLVFFSDAIFAIAMTLLVLDIPQPGPGQDVAKFLTTQDGKFIAFFISFWVIALFWLGHHRLFRYMTAYDQGVVALNLILLFCVAFLPYPSAILADHQDNVAANVFYAAAISVAGLASASLTWYAVVHRRFVGTIHPALARYYVMRGLAVVIVFGLSIPVAVWVSTELAHLMWLATFFLQLIARLVAERRAGLPAG